MVKYKNIKLMSMTAYKNVSSTFHNIRYQFFFKSLNHRFINIDIKLPDFLLPLENIIREKILSSISRGYIQFNISTTTQNKTEQIDTNNLKKMLSCLKKEGINIPHLTLADIINFTNYYNRFNILKLDNSVKNFVLRMVDKILKDVIRQKEKEGTKMGRIIMRLVSKIESYSNKIEKIIPSLEVNKQKILAAKLNELNYQLKEPQQYNDVKRVIITAFLQKSFFEEIKRLKSHIHHFKQQVTKGCGAKELDFLLQEMHREITTLLNKAEEARVSHTGVKIKKFIEDMREILNNIE